MSGFFNLGLHMSEGRLERQCPFCTSSFVSAKEVAGKQQLLFRCGTTIDPYRQVQGEQCKLSQRGQRHET